MDKIVAQLGRKEELFTEFNRRYSRPPPHTDERDVEIKVPVKDLLKIYLSFSQSKYESFNELHNSLITRARRTCETTLGELTDKEIIFQGKEASFVTASNEKTQQQVQSTNLMQKGFLYAKRNWMTGEEENLKRLERDMGEAEITKNLYEYKFDGTIFYLEAVILLCNLHNCHFFIDLIERSNYDEWLLLTTFTNEYNEFDEIRIFIDDLGDFVEVEYSLNNLIISEIVAACPLDGQKHYGILWNTVLFLVNAHTYFVEYKDKLDQQGTGEVASAAAEAVESAVHPFIDLDLATRISLQDYLIEILGVVYVKLSPDTRSEEIFEKFKEAKRIYERRQTHLNSPIDDICEGLAMKGIDVDIVTTDKYHLIIGVIDNMLNIEGYFDTRRPVGVFSSSLEECKYKLDIFKRCNIGQGIWGIDTSDITEGDLPQRDPHFEISPAQRRDMEVKVEFTLDKKKLKGLGLELGGMKQGKIHHTRIIGFRQEGLARRYMDPSCVGMKISKWTLNRTSGGAPTELYESNPYPGIEELKKLWSIEVQNGDLLELSLMPDYSVGHSIVLNVQCDYTMINTIIESKVKGTAEGDIPRKKGEYLTYFRGICKLMFPYLESEIDRGETIECFITDKELDLLLRYRVKDLRKYGTEREGGIERPLGPEHNFSRFITDEGERVKILYKLEKGKEKKRDFNQNIKEKLDKISPKTLDDYVEGKNTSIKEQEGKPITRRHMEELDRLNRDRDLAMLVQKTITSCEEVVTTEQDNVREMIGEYFKTLMEKGVGDCNELMLHLVDIVKEEFNRGPWSDIYIERNTINRFLVSSDSRLHHNSPIISLLDIWNEVKKDARMYLILYLLTEKIEGEKIEQEVEIPDKHMVSILTSDTNLHSRLTRMCSTGLRKTKAEVEQFNSLEITRIEELREEGVISGLNKFLPSEMKTCLPYLGTDPELVELLKVDPSNQENIQIINDKFIQLKGILGEAEAGLGAAGLGAAGQGVAAAIVQPTRKEGIETILKMGWLAYRYEQGSRVIRGGGPSSAAATDTGGDLMPGLMMDEAARAPDDFQLLEKKQAERAAAEQAAKKTAAAATGSKQHASIPWTPKLSRPAIDKREQSITYKYKMNLILFYLFSFNIQPAAGEVAVGNESIVASHIQTLTETIKRDTKFNEANDPDDLILKMVGIPLLEECCKKIINSETDKAKDAGALLKSIREGYRQYSSVLNPLLLERNIDMSEIREVACGLIARICIKGGDTSINYYIANIEVSRILHFKNLTSYTGRGIPDINIDISSISLSPSSVPNGKEFRSEDGPITVLKDRDGTIYVIQFHDNTSRDKFTSDLEREKSESLDSQRRGQIIGESGLEAGTLDMRTAFAVPRNKSITAPATAPTATAPRPRLGQGTAVPLLIDLAVGTNPNLKKLLSYILRNDLFHIIKKKVEYVKTLDDTMPLLHKVRFFKDEQIQELLDCEREDDFLREINEKNWIKEAQNSLYARSLSSAPLPSQLEPEPHRCVDKQCTPVDKDSPHITNKLCSEHLECQ